MTRQHASAWFCVVLLSACSAGCGMQGGTILYFMGAGRLQMVEAEYTLSEGPVLVLVDDLDERLTWAPARDRLAADLTRELLDHQVTQKVISPEAVKRHRRTHSNFDELKCTQVGRLVGADQVLWIEVTSFLAEEEIHDIARAAYLAVTVRVINPNERKDRGKVRLWPTGREGKLVAVQLNSNEVSPLRTRDRIATELTRKLAADIARLFYEHPLQSPEE